ncbi:hypothetical protein RFI_30095 [Reticulomyxa filosa]|uniref:Uncharacterized protein n=1 Tax=Reticulomyxa filosa TaxID=46433 RepID=X6M2R6_RETFI|nr:hypothetical protein RFI_30095 [Reticulomyxa filosa]|eukprot:ETO07295.1 hypothetical protein RFI_30095 [Reticulomyxa filosa]
MKFGNCIEFFLFFISPLTSFAYSMSTAPLPTTLNAPLPCGIPSVVPIHASLPQIREKDNTKEMFYIQFKYRSHGKQFIAGHLQDKYNLEEIPFHHLPNKRVIFYWLQREYQYNEEQVFDLKSMEEVMPCIAYIPSQGLLCEKAKMAKVLYQYHGDYAWTFVPRTYYIKYDFHTKAWDVSSIKKLFQVAIKQNKK